MDGRGMGGRTAIAVRALTLLVSHTRDTHDCVEKVGHVALGNLSGTWNMPTYELGTQERQQCATPSSVSGVYRVMHADPETTYRFVRVFGTFWGTII